MHLTYFCNLARY